MRRWPRGWPTPPKRCSTKAPDMAMAEAGQDRSRQHLAEKFGAALIRLSSTDLIEREGVLRQVVGLTLQASGLRQPLGGRCRVRTVEGRYLDAEVVGFAGDRTYLMPTGAVQGLVPD